jgi:hypothetical protein
MYPLIVRKCGIVKKRRKSMPNGELWQAAVSGKEILESNVFQRNFVEVCMERLDEATFEALVKEALQLTRDDMELV